MRKRIIFLVVATMLMSLFLAACGATATSQPASGATTAPSGGNMGSMPGHNMGSMATTAPAVASTTAPAISATTAPAANATAGSMPGMNMGGTDAMTEALKPLSGMDFETKFMQFMIAHHQMALDMAKLVPTNTKRPELVKLSQDIISTQTKEINDMTKWLNDWHKAKPIPSSDHMSVPGMMSMMGDNAKLAKLKDAEFDKQFLNDMIVHHQQAVNMSKLIPDKTKRPELVKIGQEITKAQTTEIEQMMGWQKAWFKAS